MTPLQPSDDRPADRDDRAGAEHQGEADAAVATDLFAHEVFLQHLADCVDCRRTTFRLVLESLARTNEEHQLLR